MTNSDLGVIDAAIPLAGVEEHLLTTAIDERAAAMTVSGVGCGVLVADRLGPAWHSETRAVDPDVVLRAVANYGDRFLGAIGADPTLGAAAVRNLRAAVGDGFVAAHGVPHAFGLPPDHPLWYPIYAACSELDVPIMLELGVRASAGPRVRSVGRPIAVDGAACDFPELKMLLLGPWPWVEEAISMAYKHANVYLGVGGADPGGRSPTLATFADSWGSGKVLFASGGSPVADALQRVSSLGLRPSSSRACLRDVARHVLLEDRNGGETHFHPAEP